MKKIILYSLVVVSSFLFATGCNEITTEDTSKVTYYIDFKMNGDQTMTVPVGSSFTDPGVVAMEGQTDVSQSVVAEGEVDASTIGMYSITYSAKNIDGFSKSVTRDVLVYDPSITLDISGTYTVDLSYSNRFQFSNSAIIKYSDMPSIYGKGDFSTFVVTVNQIVPGIYSVSDFFGGYYQEGRGLGALTAMKGYMSVNPDNSIDLLSSFINYWGDSLDGLADATYDPATQSLQWGAEYAGSYSFNVKLIKK